MKKLAWLLAAVWFVCGQTAVADEFKNVKCGGDIPKAMIGQRSVNEPVVKIEARYRALGLKHLGADEISDKLSSINWLICGTEFITLEDNKDIVRDAMPFPPHSKKTPAFSSYCELNGKKLPDIFVGILNAEVAGDQLPVISAWKIDIKNAKFIKASTEGLRCPRSAAYTVDGGL
jgi:hypothetical protein